jgi:hypothetical protein
MTILIYIYIYIHTDSVKVIFYMVSNIYEILIINFFHNILSIKNYKVGTI